MLPILVIGGFIVLFLAIRPANGGNSSGSGNPGPGTNTGLPDPGASNASMSGSASMSVPDASSGPPALPGTSKISPGTVFGRMSQVNRVALRGIGTAGVADRVPTPPRVSTTNPAVVPYSASGTRSFSGTVATTTNRNGGIKL